MSRNAVIHIFTILGLLADLIGAFLLSIPMVWNARKAALKSLRAIRSLKWFLYGPQLLPIKAKSSVPKRGGWRLIEALGNAIRQEAQEQASLWIKRSGRPSYYLNLASDESGAALTIARHRLAILAIEFSILFFVIVVALVRLQFIPISSGVSVGFSLDIIGPVIISIVVMIVLGFFAASFLAIPRMIARFFIWVARGNRERKIGRVGLGILCVGFVLQAIVNLL